MLVPRARLGFLPGVSLLCWYLAHAWFFWCSIVMLVSRARLVFLGVSLLCWYHAHTCFFWVFHCYVGISRTLGFFRCSFVMLVSCARLVFLGVPLLCWYLAHAWFFLVFCCYVSISRTVSFPVAWLTSPHPTHFFYLISFFRFCRF